MTAKPKPKRGLVVADFHTGHQLGLTPPDWDPGGDSERQVKTRAIRNLIWNFFSKAVKEYGPFDFAIHNGDLVDGPQPAERGIELILNDGNEQVKAAADIIKFINAKKNYISFGTPYHTGKAEDQESLIAEKVGADIGGHEWLNVNGLIISYKHHIGGSSIPHGRNTPVARERLWELLWAERGDYPKAELLIRSHVHYYSVTGGLGWTALTTPALQGYGVKYARRLSGMVDIGLIVLDVVDAQHWSWTPIILRGMGSLRTKAHIV